ncbi:MAG: hypothetical protein A4E48_00261 [Methanosaeta sp. PtaU1.Bin060]|nr:MAG: hypothetical protein A4E48_00261 [Methanosaeta sp. PtaU1.Bin060]
MNDVLAHADIKVSEYYAGGANSAKYESLMPFGGRAFGQLASIQPDDNCQIAQIGERLIVLPEDLDLHEHVGHRIGICRIEGQYHIRRLP